MLIQDIIQLEGYKVPAALMEELMDCNRREVFLSDVLKNTADISYDYMRDIFQKEHSDRDRLKQDYTPASIVKLLAKLMPDGNSVADICAGTGTLSVGTRKPNYIYCEEFSERAIPFLLCNYALRNMFADVVRCNSLTGEIFATYHLEPGQKFSTIEIIPSIDIPMVDNVIMNPPYSMKWSPIKSEQYNSFGDMPNIADYPFLLHGLHILKEQGTLIAILPHGILFRGNKEGKIRQQLIEKNLIHAVIGLPDKCFMNTDIPTLLLVLKKNRTEKDILFIDASKTFIKQGKQNIFTEEQIEKIADAYRSRKPIEKFADIADLAKIQDNSYNMNIPRYVDTFIPQPVEELDVLINELAGIEREIHGCEMELVKMLADLRGTNLEEDKKLSKAKKLYSSYIREKYNGTAKPIMDSLF